MADRWEEIPPSPERGYGGMTKLHRDGRTIAAMGVGDQVRQAITAKADKVTHKRKRR